MQIALVFDQVDESVLDFFAIARPCVALTVAFVVDLKKGRLEGVTHVAYWQKDLVFPLIVQFFLLYYSLLFLSDRHSVA